MNTSGTVTFTGYIYLGTSGGAAMPVTLTAAPGGTVSLPVRSSGTGAHRQRYLVSVGKVGTVVFTGATAITRRTMIQNGTLVAAGGDDALR